MTTCDIITCDKQSVIVVQGRNHEEGKDVRMHFCEDHAPDSEVEE